MGSGGKRCLVLGGTGYVGSAVCRTLNACGAKVVFTFHNNQALAEQMQNNCEALHGLRVDALCYGAVKNAVAGAAEHLGGLDSLIQCIGSAGEDAFYQGVERGEIDKFLDIDESAWDEMLAITAKSTFAACQAAAPVMHQSGGGNIVIVGSVDGSKSVPAPIHYAAAKGALTAMTRTLAKELGRYAICINQIALGILDGGLSSALSAQLKTEYLKHSCLGRFGSAGDVAGTVSWYALENTYITGQVIALDGGL